MNAINCYFAIIALSYVSCKHEPFETVPPPTQPISALPTTNCDTQLVSYPHDIVPILSTHCYSCHSGQAPVSGLDLSNYTTVKDLGINDGHYLLNTVNGNPDYVYMPPAPASKLSSCEIASIRTWIRQGAHPQ